MFKVAILIYAHKNYQQVQRLINRLKNNNVDIYVHADSKNNWDDFGNAITLKNRTAIKWGKPEIVNSIVLSLKIINKYKDYDYYILLSGQDYLLLPMGKIVEFLEENNGKEFIEYKKIGKNNDEWDVSARYSYYHFNNELFDKLSRHIFNKRSFIDNWTAYGGSMWWMLTGAAVKYVINAFDEHKISEKIKFTSCIDEILFQSILCNSPFKNKIVNNAYRYIDWSEHKAGKNKGNPNILKTCDFDKLINSGCFFARKFDIAYDEHILDMLDAKIDAR